MPRKSGVALLAAAAFILPIGLKYNNDAQSPQAIAANQSFPADLPDMNGSVWLGGSETLPATVNDRQNMSMSAVTTRLEEKLKNNPDDTKGWILLGRSYGALGDADRARRLFEEKITEHPDNIDLLVSYGEALAQMNGGNISDEAYSLFKKASGLQSDNPRAGYNLALYEIQKGQNQQAYDRLNDLINKAPQKAPWTSQLEKQKDIAAQNLGISTAASTAPPNPTAQQITAANNMSEQDRIAMIDSMVAGLADKLKENPDDLQGWVRLGKSYAVLGKWQQSAQAYKKAIILKPNDLNLKKLYDQAVAKYNK